MPNDELPSPDAVLQGWAIFGAASVRRAKPDDITAALDAGVPDFTVYAYVRVEETLKQFCPDRRERIAFERTLRLLYREAQPMCELGRNYLVVQLCVRRFKKELARTIERTPPAVTEQ